MCEGVYNKYYYTMRDMRDIPPSSDLLAFRQRIRVT